MLKQRLLNFEFLRIIAMFLIVLIHCLYHLDFKETKFLSSYIAINLMVIIAKTAVNIFVLLTGYFLVSKKNAISRVFKLLGVVFFYQIAIGLFCHYFIDTDSNIISMNVFNPFKYWFINNYLALVLLSPFINIFINSLNKERYIVFLFFLFICNVIFGNLTSVNNGFSLIWFLNLFLVGRFFSLFSIKLKRRNVSFTILLGLCFVLVFNFFIYNRSTFSSGVFNNFLIGSVGSYSHLFTVLFSVLFFLFFKKTNYNHLFFSKLGQVSPYLLGVYLIHDNMFLKEFIWNNKITKSIFYDTIYNPLVVVIYAFSIFVSCVLIDYFRSQLFIFFKYSSIVNKISDYTLKIFNKLLVKVSNQLIKLE